MGKHIEAINNFKKAMEKSAVAFRDNANALLLSNMKEIVVEDCKLYRFTTDKIYTSILGTAPASILNKWLNYIYEYINGEYSCNEYQERCYSAEEMLIMDLQDLNKKGLNYVMAVLRPTFLLENL